MELGRNYHLNQTLVKTDTIVSVTLIVFLLVLTKLWAIVLAPAFVFVYKRFGDRVGEMVFRERRIPRLPKNFKEQVSSVISVPKNVMFMRGGGNDCKSVSLFFIHLVLIPEFFETDLQNPNKQAVLLHEFAHGQFTDYLSVSWIWFAGIALAFVTFMTFLPIDGGNVQRMIESSPGKYNFAVPLIVILLFCIPDAVGMIHRREINADFGAYRANPRLFRRYLENQIAKSRFFKTKKFELDVVVKNWLFHPSYKKRLAIITESKRTSYFSSLLPAILIGLCPTYMVLSLLSALFFSNATIIVFPLSLFCIVQMSIVLNEVFGRNSNLEFWDKAIFWLGLLIGYELFALVYFYVVNPGNGGDVVVLATNDVLVTMALPSVAGLIFLSHVVFAAYFRLCTWFFGKSILASFSTPIFTFLMFSAIEGIEMTGSVSLSYAIIFVGVVIVVLIFLMLFLEFVFQSISSGTMRLFRSF